MTVSRAVGSRYSTDLLDTEFEQQRKILQRWRPDVLSDHKVEL